MDKYEYKIREEEIKELISAREFEEAAEVADTIDWRRVKSVKMLCMVSDVYKKNRRYEDSRDLLLLAYDRHPGGRTIVYSLCELAIKMGDFGQALEYCKEFIQLAPKDPGRYILQYKLYEAQEVGLEERIAVLEELKKRDYREKWAYELAYLYHLVGMETKCVEECDELIVWFGDGKYVIKAMELKMQHQPLTIQQQEKYDNRFNPPVQEEMVVEPLEEPDSGQAEILTAETIRVPVEEIDIQVKTLGLSKCDTINLQAEVAAGLKEVLGEEGTQRQPALKKRRRHSDIVFEEAHTEDFMMGVLQTTEIVMQDAEAEMEETPQQLEDIESLAVEEIVQEELPETEVAGEDVDAVEEVLEAVKYDVAESTAEELAEKENAEQEKEDAEPVHKEVEEAISRKPESLDWQAEENMQEEQLVLPIMDIKPTVQSIGSIEPPKEMAKVLSMEGDGQISFIMPETVALEKQITGQMNFNDILLEWERMKLELEEKRKENVRQMVLRNTGAMFSDFEASVRDGLLEQLENGKSMEEILPQAENLELQVVEELLEEAEDVADEAVAVMEEVTEEADAIEEIAEDAVSDFEELEENVEPVAVDEAQELVGQAVDEFEELEEVVEIPEEMEETSQELVEETQEAFEELVMEELAEEIEEIEEAPAEIEVEELGEVSSDVEEEIEEAPVEIDKAEAELVDEQEEAEENTESTEDLEEVIEDTEDTEEITEQAEDAVELVEEFEEPEDDEEEEEASEAEENTSVRNMTKEEKELFAPFIQGRESKEQLIQALEVISLAAYTGNVVITGREGLDTIGLAKSIIREIQNTDSNFSGKVAKISGNSLNKRNVAEIVEGLENGALIVQKAGDINEATAKSLYKILQQETRGIVVILEGTKRAINGFFERYMLLEPCFNARIDMEALSDDALVAFANKYAKEHECSIDEFGMLALHRTISDRQTSDHAVTVLEVKEIMDDAIASANRKTLGHFFSLLAAKRYDDEDMIIIRENDFM